jgi:predicted RNA polymerase sigma factor
MTRPSTAAAEAAFREERAAVLATLIRQVGDFQLAENAVQDAFAEAIVAWDRDGIPAKPGVWITTTARRPTTSCPTACRACSCAASCAQRRSASAACSCG